MKELDDSTGPVVPITVVLQHAQIRRQPSPKRRYQLIFLVGYGHRISLLS
jgi:hypothetical protein